MPLFSLPFFLKLSDRPPADVYSVVQVPDGQQIISLVLLVFHSKWRVTQWLFTQLWDRNVPIPPPSPASSCIYLQIQPYLAIFNLFSHNYRNKHMNSFILCCIFKCCHFILCEFNMLHM